MAACNGNSGNPDPDDKEPIGWDGNSITYTASDIRSFGSGTPRGTVNYDNADDVAVIWNIDSSLDNYGGVQTPMLSLDFSKAVIFEMDVVDVYTEYIVKLSVEGENEYYYVLSDEGETGTVSVNVVDAMLSDKYRTRMTQPDPGYATGWKYAGETKNCAFHILAKGPSGEQQTAELKIRSISIYNDKQPITSVEILSNSIEDNVLRALKGTTGETLSANVYPVEDDNQSVLWRSADPNVVSVSPDGSLTFHAVGNTEIYAISSVDQSKRAVLPVVSLSGYENPADLSEALNDIAYDGSSADLALFDDLFRTTWGDDILQPISMGERQALSLRGDSGNYVVENAFERTDATMVNQATNDRVNDGAFVPFQFDAIDTATIYRNINGYLYQETYDGTLAVRYADFDGSFRKTATYRETGILKLPDGTLRKYAIEVLDVTRLGSYGPADFLDESKWITPDRTRQDEDATIHALSPASVSIDGDLARIRQDKYPEAKYMFGGLVSEAYNVGPDDQVEIVLDVAALTRMNDFVITMWEVKILYYDANGTVINSNPIKIDSGNTTGVHVVRFDPAYDNFRIYLVVNGSDIGAQFEDARIDIRSFKIQIID